MHIIEPIKLKHRAVERAEVFNNDRFPLPLRDYLKRLVVRDRDTAGKQFLLVMTLLHEYHLTDIVAAVVEAHERGVDDPAAIGLLLRRRVRPEVAPLSTAELPTGAQISVIPATLEGYAIADLKETAA
jgi:hypothetical protein